MSNVTLLTIDRETGQTIRTPWPTSEQQQMEDAARRLREGRLPRRDGTGTGSWFFNVGRTV